MQPGETEDKELKCQVCGESLPPREAIGCARCAAPYHVDCYHYIGTCSIFGCGHDQTAPYEQLGNVVPSNHSVTITEGTRPEFSLKPYLEGMQRKFLTRSKHLPMTIGAGLLGSLMTMVGFAVFVSSTHHASLWIGLLFCGLAPGILSPFVAPTQHRQPGLASAVSGLAFMTCYGLRLVGSRFFWSTMTVATGIFFATSLAEAVFGKLTPAGQALGRFATPVRHLASWGFFLLSIFTGAWLFGEHLTSLAYQEISMLSLLALVAAVPALEMGKEEYKREISATPSRQGLPQRPLYPGSAGPA